MMTALRDFARDSFHTAEHAGLDSFALDDLTVWAESGPGAVLAAVIRGQPPLSLREVMQRAVEEVHLAHAEDIERFGATGMAFPVRDGILERCLVSKAHDGAPRAGGWRLWLLTVLVLSGVGWCTVPRVIEQRRLGRYLEQLRREPGVVVGSVGREGGKLVISGLRDPLARDPKAMAAAAGFDTASLDAKWEPYVALRPEFVLTRANALLVPSSRTSLRLSGDTLIASGVASAAWRREAQRLALAVPGVAALHLAALADSAEVALRATADSLEQVTFDFPLGSAVPVAGQERRVDSLATRIRAFLADAARGERTATIELVGSADSVGSEATNAILRQARASRTRSALIARGANPAWLIATPDTSDTDRTLRQVHLKITLSRQ